MKYFFLNNLFIFLLFCVGNLSNSYKILGVVPAPPHSHFTLGFRLMKALADKGHEVTFINSHPQKVPVKNIRDVSTEEIKKIFEDYTTKLVDLGEWSYWKQLNWVADLGAVKSRLIFKNKNVQNLLKSNETFDLVISNHLFSDAFAYFAYKFKCPLIILTPGSTNLFSNYLVANPSPPSYVTNLLADYGADMNFWQRFSNIIRELVGEIFIHNILIPKQNQVLKELFPDAPELTSILYDASLILAASHSSFYDPIPLQQNVKEIGGYHVQPPKPLPKDLQEFMDNSPEGVVIFSMGSNLKSADFHPEKRKAILNAFSKLKQKVLWKFETDLPDKPKNVKISNWLPQSDILAHRNVLGFISHGGLLGTTEAVYHGVPILGLPIFWDQIKNVDVAVSKGFAVKLDFHNLDEKSFGDSLNEILNNPTYREAAKERSSIMHDQPIKQIDEAVFWCEYVIRHKGAQHLRSPALNLRWYQSYYIDIIIFISVVLITLLLITKYLLIFIFKKFFIKENNEKKNK
ncbi:UDP-glucosyltransferase 2-like [Diorhabda sublineata]|uniref:UDP-glucosyltransferase 2-like n=1 Tax=Diorhabda sublineata TaxID=1163346 RepID=UPI0024E0AE41|nr:UDP-glucosyltransferase 2-like [Diorhabda sublineata]